MKTITTEPLIKNIDNISHNDLSELTNLIYRITHLINNDFLHVADELPDNFRNQLADIKDELCEECNKRENQF